MIRLSQPAVCAFVIVMKKAAHTRQTYHHGNLAETLIREAARLLAEKGVEGFSMREVARRAGVAVAAPSYHFGNAKGLLTAVAAHGFDQLATRQKAALASAEDPVEKVIALCRTYVDMGVRFPGCAAVMFRMDVLDDSDQRFREAAFRAFDLLHQAVAKAVPAETEAIRINHASKTLWATMHGLLTLDVIEDDETEEILCFSVRALLAGMQ